MGPDWIPSGLVSRRIAERLTKAGDEYEQASLMPIAPETRQESRQETLQSERISMERPRLQRPQSA